MVRPQPDLAASASRRATTIVQTVRQNRPKTLAVTPQKTARGRYVQMIR